MLRPGQISLLVLATVSTPAVSQSALKPTDLAGRWARVGGHDTTWVFVTGKGVRLQGQTGALWYGAYSVDTAGKRLLLNLSVYPQFFEMNPDIPEWARHDVYRTLKWTLSLGVARQGSGSFRMDGDWYRGDVKWYEEKDGQRVRLERASVLGPGPPIHVEYRKLACTPLDSSTIIETARVRATLKKSERIAEGFKKDPMTHMPYWFGRLYYYITQSELDHAGKLKYPGFLLHFIPIFYDMYAENAERYQRNEPVNWNWQVHFGTGRETRDPPPWHDNPPVYAKAATDNTVLGVKAHIKGDMANALTTAYESFAAKYCDVPPFDSLKTDFFETNKPIFEEVTETFIFEFKTALSMMPGGRLMGAPKATAIAKLAEFMQVGLSVDEIYAWRDAAWTKARSELTSNATAPPL